MGNSRKKISNYLINGKLSGLRRESGHFWRRNTSPVPAWKQTAIPRTCRSQPSLYTELIIPTMKPLLGLRKADINFMTSV